MPSFQCKLCGATIEYQTGENVAVCEYCGGEQAVPTPEGERKHFCPHCGKSVAPGASFCPNCGKSQNGGFGTTQIGDVLSRVSAELTRGIGKASESLQNAASDDIIGKAFGSTSQKPETDAGEKPKQLKDKWVSLILCLFLGGFGAHRFYEGKILLGIVYLLTGGLFTIGIIIDTITYLTKKDRYYEV